MPKAGKLAEKNGKLYLEVFSAGYNKPENLLFYYPFSTSMNDSNRHWFAIGGEVYVAYLGGLPEYTDDKGNRLYLVDGRDTLPTAEFTEALPVPRPRGKEVRWQYGKWERYSKSKGWH